MIAPRYVGALDDDEVAAVEERLADELERLDRAARDQQLVVGRPAALQRLEPCRRARRAGRRARASARTGRRVASPAAANSASSAAARSRGNVARVGEAARERDQVGHAEEREDRRRSPRRRRRACAPRRAPPSCVSGVTAMAPTIECDRWQPRRRRRERRTATRYRWDDMPKEMLKPDLARRLIATERMMLAHVYLEQGLHRPRSTARERAADVHPRRRAPLLARRGRVRGRRRRRRRGAAHPLEPAAQGRGARDDARRRHLLSAAAGLARRIGRVPAPHLSATLAGRAAHRPSRPSRRPSQRRDRRRTSTTARRRSSTRCSGSPARSARTRTSANASWIRPTSSARRGSRSSPRTRPCDSATRRSTSSTRPATLTSAEKSSAG